MPYLVCIKIKVNSKVKAVIYWHPVGVLLAIFNYGNRRLAGAGEDEVVLFGRQAEGKTGRNDPIGGYFHPILKAVRKSNLKIVPAIILVGVRPAIVDELILPVCVGQPIGGPSGGFTYSLLNIPSRPKGLPSP